MAKQKELMTDNIASRFRTWEWMGWWGFLPDPDPVLGKLGEGLGAYRKLLTDAHVWSCFTSRTAATLDREWRVEYPERLRRKGAARVLARIDDALTRLDMRQVITDMLFAPYFGMAPCEVDWEVRSGLWLPKAVVGKPAEWFVFSTENELRFLSIDNLLEGESLPERKFLNPRHYAGYDNPYGERLLSRCFWPVAFKKGGYKFWAMFAEKYGMPWAVGKTPRSSTAEERAELLGCLGRMVQDAVAVINNDDSVELVEAGSRSASGDIYKGLVDACNAEVSKAIVGQTLTTEIGERGSYAASQTHMEVRADIAGSDQSMVRREVNRLIGWIVELNFPGSAVPEFYFYEEEDIHRERADRDKTLYDQGVRLSKEYYQRAYGFGDDEVVVVDAVGEVDEADGADEVDGGEADFAEGGGGPDHEALDAMAEGAAALTASLMAERAAKIRDAMAAEDLDRALEVEPDGGRFEELLARSMFAALAEGYGDAGRDV